MLDVVGIFNFSERCNAIDRSSDGNKFRNGDARMPLAQSETNFWQLAPEQTEKDKAA
jgi:hypothetical protein